MKNGKSSGRPNKKSKQPGRTQSSHDASALFLPISFFAALAAWRLLSAPVRFGSGYPQISRRKPIIRTRLLLEKGSDYMDVVPVVGLEPTRCCHQRILSPSRLPIPSHRRIERLGTVQTSFSLLYNKCAQIARHFCFDFHFTQEGNLLQTILSHSRPNKQIGRAHV